MCGGKLVAKCGKSPTDSVGLAAAAENKRNSPLTLGTPPYTTGEQRRARRGRWHSLRCLGAPAVLATSLKRLSGDGIPPPNSVVQKVVTAVLVLMMAVRALGREFSGAGV